ncbi:hypothetical protein FBUS_08449 [Fasciolopsis buskii]|uniref:Uncharacterized protein n=1 Tax=Fasciolopsis buskii TaxID=27845 RepID=A0A8E0RMC8_9TREM|nr:hypothetical protein FBUS_08449 [Fasciolopsis buski]
MKSLLKRALQQTITSKETNLQKSINPCPRKKPNLYKDRKKGRLKRLRNEQRQKLRNVNQSWKVIRNPKKHRNRPHADSDMPKAFISLSEDAHLVSLGKRIIKSRRSLMGTKQVKAKAKSADTILFRDLDMDIKDIICS